ncbi:MAG: ATP-binding protein, partial [Candidatus Fermentibacteraceae bacterium]|nr:ATP-binding protein [Candidatus Fermentibacteraceae bacterium]
ITSIAQVFDGYDNLGIMGRSATTDIEKLINVAEVYHENPDQLENVFHVMETLGMQMDGITIKPATVINEGEKVDVFIPVSKYKVDGKTFELQMVFESDGTRAVFTILEPILDVLENGSILILDELDQDMHPNLVQSLIAVMLEKAYNRSNCQIVCSTHCVEILNKLHKNQIYLVERNDSNYESTITRLADISGVTNKDNFRAKYLAGAFGAVPEQY